MVERLLCKQDVSGSSPLTSTKREDFLTKIKSTVEKKLSIIRERLRMLSFELGKNLENCIKKEKSKHQLETTRNQVVQK